MRVIHTRLRYFLIALAFFGLCSRASGQINFIPKPDTAKAGKDTVNIKGPEEVKGGFLGSDTSMTTLLAKLENLSLNLNRDLSILRKGFDTTELSRDLPDLTEGIANLKNRMELPKTGSNIRNLNSYKVLMQQIEIRLRKYQDQLGGYNLQLETISGHLVSARLDSALYFLPKDSVLLKKYLEKVEPINVKFRAVDSLLGLSFQRIGLLQNEVSNAFFSNSELLEQVQEKVRLYQSRFLYKDSPFLWDAQRTPREKGFGEIIIAGLKVNTVLSLFYLLQNAGTFLVILFCALLFLALNKYNLRRLKMSDGKYLDLKLIFVRKSVVLCVFLMIFTLSPFIFRNPPAGLVQTFWILVLLTTTAIRWRDWPASFRKLWVAFMVIFFFFSLDSFLLLTNLFERYFLLLLNMVAIIYAWFMYKEVCKDKSRFHSLMDESIIVFGVVNILAVAANLFGHFNLAKELSNSSSLSIALLLSLQIIKFVLLESVTLHVETHRNSRYAIFADFDQKSHRLKKILDFLALFFWVLSFAWSLNFYDLIYDKVVFFLGAQRILGEFKFSYATILTFVGIIWLSMLAERLVTLIFQAEEGQGPSTRKNKTGSWLLFAKLGIYVVGFLLALAAAGIPMDRLAIVLGALSVGIGFGLQNIVNNLVSGIILVVEKPMEVGDVIELGTRTGTVREIGFRSSKIATYEGSMIIVPNADFISQQLVNWTHSNNNFRRVDIIVGVPYGSDLEKVKNLIGEILRNHSEVSPFPAPVVVLHEFASSSVNFRALFWTAEFDKWLILKSDVLQEIYAVFGKYGIKIPFPQQDLHLRSIDPMAAEALRGDSQPDQSQ